MKLELFVLLAIATTTTARSTRKQPEFGIIFDAGGSGTRMFIYEFDANDTPVQRKYMECEDEGLTRYKNVDELIKPLKKCLDAAAEAIPSDDAKEAPIWFEATAGMRLLSLVDKSQHDKIIEKVKQILNNSAFPVRKVETISGNEEALHSWTTVNSLLKKNKTNGMIEMGSSSVQIAFVPKKIDASQAENYDEVTVNGKKHHVYMHSYLCLGKNEMMRRYYAKLLRVAKYASEVEDPCSFSGLNVKRKVKDIFQAPCVKGNYAKDNMPGGSYEYNNGKKQFLFKGTSNYEKCYANIKAMFSKEHSRCGSNCGINGVYQPPVRGPYYTVGSAIYYSALFAGVTGKANEKKMEAGARNLCSLPLSVVEKMRGYNPKYANANCFTDTYIVYLLKEVLKYDGTVNFVKKINGNKLSWTFGAAISHHEGHDSSGNASTDDTSVAE